MLTHEEVQAAISARLDGEPHGLEDDVVDAHLESCAQCRAFRDEAAALSRSLAFGEPAGAGMAPPQDLSDIILAGVEPQWRKTAGARQAGRTLSRAAIAVTGAIFAVWAVVLIITASGLEPTNADGSVLDPGADPVRAALLMEGAATRFGLASGLIFAAWRPRFAAGLFPVACTMFLFLFGFAMRDIVWGTIEVTQVYFLLATGLAAACLGWGWAADRGYALQSALRSIGSGPRNELY